MNPRGRCRLKALVLLTSLIIAGAQTLAQSKAPQSKAAPKKPSPAISIGDEPIVILKRPPVVDRSTPQFLEATVLPGRGMAVLEIKAYLPGKGEIDLLNAPPLPEAKQLLDKQDDEFGNEVFKIGGAILLPFANRIRGALSPDGKTITATVAGKTVTLPANWSGPEPGAEKCAIHGLMRRAQFEAVITRNGAADSSVDAVYHARNFDDHWLSDTDVEVQTTLSHEAFAMTVTATNVGVKPLPMGIGWHPYFLLPGGDRAQVRLHIPSLTRALINDYNDTFTTGQRASVKGTAYDFSAPEGRPLGSQYLDDNFSNLLRDQQGRTVTELVDPAAKYGLRLITLSPQIKSIQIYAPSPQRANTPSTAKSAVLGSPGPGGPEPKKNFVAIEPQFNLPDPYSQNWGWTDTGMVLLQPGQSVSWRIRLELFTPKE